MGRCHSESCFVFSVFLAILLCLISRINFRMNLPRSMYNLLEFIVHCSVAQSCLTLCDPMEYSMPGFLSFIISWSLLKLMSIVSVMPSNHLILCRPLPLLPSIFPASGSFQMSQFFSSGGQSIGVSASASVLPMNIQD